MKLVVGLGNPGRRYAYSRHNVGFLVVELLAKKLAAGGRWQVAGGKKFQAKTLTTRYPSKTPRSSDSDRDEVGLSATRLILVKPQTYMNESGRAVKTISSFYKIKPRDILAVSDDVDMEFGKIRFRERGSSGGHRGLNSIIENLKTEEFPRLKIGIGREPKTATDRYVLANFTAAEKRKLPEVVEEAAEKIKNWL